MKREERAARIGEQLAALYPNPPIPLDHSSPFTLLVAVLLSAQCTDKRVNTVTPALFALASTAEEMAALPVSEIQRCIRSCGLAPTKAKNISALSKQLLRKHAGEVQADLKELESLPGVGHKTASVVLAQAFGIPAFPVDTHIYRLARRWALSDGTTVKRVEIDLKALYAPHLWNPLHLQIIFFGREHCPARGHHPEQCPICSWTASPND